MKSNYVIEEFLKLQATQEQEFPGYIFIPITELIQAYRLQGDALQADNVRQYDQDFSGITLSYILPPGEYGAEKDKCCVGIRFGDEGGEYISLGHLPSHTYLKIINNQEIIKSWVK